MLRQHTDSASLCKKKLQKKLVFVAGISWP